MELGGLGYLTHVTLRLTVFKIFAVKVWDFGAPCNGVYPQRGDTTGTHHAKFHADRWQCGTRAEISVLGHIQRQKEITARLKYNKTHSAAQPALRYCRSIARLLRVQQPSFLLTVRKPSYRIVSSQQPNRLLTVVYFAQKVKEKKNMRMDQNSIQQEAEFNFSRGSDRGKVM